MGCCDVPSFDHWLWPFDILAGMCPISPPCSAGASFKCPFFPSLKCCLHSLCVCHCGSVISAQLDDNYLFVHVHNCCRFLPFQFVVLQ